MKFFIFALFLSAYSSFSVASETSGHAVLANCKAALSILGAGSKTQDKDLLGRGMSCLAMLDGIMTYNDTLSIMYEVPFCIPSGTRLGDALKVVVKNMENNPKYLNGKGAKNMVIALVDNFPCRSN